MIVYYYDANGFYLYSATQDENIPFQFSTIEPNTQFINNKWNGTEWTEGASEEEITLINNEENKRFIYNNEFEINQKDDFSIWSNFFLNGDAVIDNKGDKSQIIWKNNNGNTAIVEELVYTRYKVGTGLLAQLFLKRDLSVKYYRKNGTFELVVLPTRVYNENERVSADKKSRSNIIERVRKNTGAFIYQTNLQNGTPQNITPQLQEALKLFDTLQKQITLYREEREHLPLVTALQGTSVNDNLMQSTLNYIINAVNIDYYGS